MNAIPGKSFVAPAPRHGTLLLALLVVPLALALWRFVLGLTLLGWDTWPLIATARVHGPGELLGMLGRELMDGRYPLGHYWRPVTQLSFALDHALFGLAPRGYHATDLAILVVSGVLVGRIVLGWPTTTGASGRYARIAALAAACLAAARWVLDGTHFEILTVPARRADALAVLWTLLALLLQLGPWSPRRAVAVAASCALALGSKEAGAVAAPLVLLLAWYQSAHLFGERGLRARARGVLRRSVAVVVATGALVGARWLVLGGAGGGEEAALALDPAHVVELAGDYLLSVLVPPEGTTLGGAQWLGILIVGATLLLLPLALAERAARRREGEDRDAKRGLPVASAGAFFGLWLLGLTAVVSTSGVFEAWYALPYLAAVSVASGWLARTALEALEHRALLARAAAALVLALVLFGGVQRAGGARDAQALADHLEVSHATEQLLDELAAKLEAAPPGSSLAITVGTEWVRIYERCGVLERKILPIGTYGIEAWAELRFPERRVFVETAGAPGGGARAPGPDEVRLVVRAETRRLGGDTLSR